MSRKRNRGRCEHCWLRPTRLGLRWISVRLNWGEWPARYRRLRVCDRCWWQPGVKDRW